MAIDEESFYNIVGEEINRSSLVEQMVDFYALKLEVGDTRVTDFNEGSEIRNLLEAIAVDLYYMMEEQNELSLISFIDTAEGEWLDKHGANPFIKLLRDTGMESTGYVVFTIPNASTQDIVIPEETVLVSEETGLEFATEGEAIIPVGDTNVTVSAICLTTGADGNAEPNTITMIDDDFIEIPELSVNNPSSFTGGTDYEEDDEYRERLLSYVRQDDFGSIGYYTNLGDEVEGVHDVYLIDEEGFTKKVLVNGDVKPTPADVLCEVLEVYSNTENIVVGHTFTVGKPIYVKVNMKLDLTVSEEISNDIIREAMTYLVNGGEGNMLIGYDYEGLSIGETLFISSIVSTLELLDGVESVSVLDGHDEDLSDIVVGSNEVIELGTLTITQTVR